MTSNGAGWLSDRQVVDRRAQEGTRVVLVSFDTPLSPAAGVAERNAIFDSIRIEP